VTYRNTEEALRARCESLEERLRDASRMLADVMGRGDNSVEVKLRALLDEQAEALRSARSELASQRHKHLVSRLVSRGGEPARLLAIGAGVGLVLLTAYFLAVLGAACASPLHAGYVVGRYHHPEYITTTTVCTGSKNQTCVPVVQYHPDRWTVRVALDDQTREIDLEHGAWLDVDMGTWFCVPGEDCASAPGAHWAVEE